MYRSPRAISAPGSPCLHLWCWLLMVTLGLSQELALDGPEQRREQPWARCHRGVWVSLIIQ